MTVLERPTYDPASVVPLREELVDVGFTELLTPEAVESALLDPANNRGITLVVINSVCGCAAGNARPGVAKALQNDKIPDRLYTVFAGMEKAAVARMREILAPNPPSSPSMAFFKDGELIAMVHRREIESRTAAQLAELLVGFFDRYCHATGPSIPPEKFALLRAAKVCGSTLPLYGHAS